MTTVKERPVVINLHNPTSSIVWQYALLVLGFLGFMTSLTSDLFVYGTVSSIVLVYGIASSIVLVLSTSLFLKSRPLILTSSSIKLPQGAMKECTPQSITSLKLTKKTSLEIEITEQNEKTKEKLDLKFLSKEDASRLWLWITKHLSHAQIDSQTREALLNWQQYRASPADESTNNENSNVFPNENSQLELTFVPQNLLSASLGRKSLLIKTFGQIWLTLCLICCTAIFYAITAKLRTPTDILGDLGLIGFMIYFLTPVGLCSLCPANVSGIIALGIILLIIYTSLRQIRPNSLFIDHLGLTLQYRQLVSRQTESYSTIFHSHIPWLAIVSIRLCKEFPLSPTADCLLFEKAEGKSPFRIPLNFMRSNKEKQLLLTLLQKFQQNHDYQIDTPLIDALKYPSSYVPEYTQLWLKNLLQQQEHKTSHLDTGQAGRPNLEIIHKIASGGQAMTYKVKKICSADETYQDTKQTLEEIVVLKEFFLPTKNATIYKSQVSKFEKTAALLKELHHPNLVRIDNYFFDAPKACLLLEYIEGTTLAESVTNDGIFSESKAIDLALTMCDILSYLHAQNPPLLHLDFTPDNLILDKKEQLKLIDLDCCLVHSDHAGESQDSPGALKRTVIGKQNYIPREQFQGHPDNRSDIFALGATLFYLTTSQKPEPFEILHPQKYNPFLSKGFDEIVAKAAAVLADERHSTAGELKKEFLALKESLEANNGINTTSDVPATITTRMKTNKHSSDKLK